MSLTIGEILSSAATKMRLATSATFVGSTDPTVQALLASINVAAKKIISEFDWEVLRKVYTFTLQNNVRQYALPEDYLRVVTDTTWNVTERESVLAGASPSHYNYLRFSTTTPSDSDSFTIFGSVDSQITFPTAPSGMVVGETVSFEYISSAWLRPRSWTPATFVPAQRWLWANGRVYRTENQGLLSSSPPTHSSGTVLNGAVNLRFMQSFGYERLAVDPKYFDNFNFDRFADDFSVPLIDDLLLLYGTIIDFANDEAFDTSQYKIDYQMRLEQLKNARGGAPTFNHFRRRRIANIPDRGYGLP